MGHKTSKIHFDIFKKECNYWIEKFGLKEWNVDFQHDDNIEGSLASCSVNLPARKAIIFLEPLWGDDNPTPQELKRVAFHEVMELFLSPVWYLAEERFVTANQLEENRHGVIRTMENCVWKDDVKKRLLLK